MGTGGHPIAEYPDDEWDHAIGVMLTGYPGQSGYIAAMTASPEVEAHLVSRLPIGRIGTAEEIAEAAVWLCTDAASFVLGTTLAVDGGYTAV